MQDRMVYACHLGKDPIELVRYDSAGKYFLERPNGQRQQMKTVKDAAEATVALLMTITTAGTYNRRYINEVNKVRYGE